MKAVKQIHTENIRWTLKRAIENRKIRLMDAATPVMMFNHCRLQMGYVRLQVSWMPRTKQNYVTRCLLTFGGESPDLLKDGADQFPVGFVEVRPTVGTTEDVFGLLCKILRNTLVHLFHARMTRVVKWQEQWEATDSNLQI